MRHLSTSVTRTVLRAHMQLRSIKSRRLLSAGCSLDWIAVGLRPFIHWQPTVLQGWIISQPSSLLQSTIAPLHFLLGLLSSRARGCAWDAQVGREKETGGQNKCQPEHCRIILWMVEKTEKHTHEANSRLYHIKHPGESYLSKLQRQEQQQYEKAGGKTRKKWVRWDYWSHLLWGPSKYSSHQMDMYWARHPEFMLAKTSDFVKNCNCCQHIWAPTTFSIKLLAFWRWVIL